MRKISENSGAAKCPSTHFLIPPWKKQNSFRQVRCSWCQPPSQISVLISLSTWLSHHHPPLSHRFCPTRGQICVLWPTPSNAAFIIPQPLRDRQDWSPLQQPSTLTVKGQQWKKPSRGPTEDGLMNQTCTQSFLLITEVSPGINTPWLEGATYCDLSRFPWTELGTAFRSQTSKRGPPSNTVTSH